MFDVLINRGFRWQVNPHMAATDPAFADDDTFYCGEADDDGFQEIFDAEYQAFEMDGRQSCPYCRCSIPVVPFRDDKIESAHDDRWALCRFYVIASCLKCGFWKFLATEHTNRCMDAPTSVAASSIVRRFTAPIPPGCAHDIAQYLSGDSNRWDDLSPKALEILVADIFRANYQDAEVMHVGRPGDLGVDVIFIESGPKMWLIQVKRRRRGKAEGFSTLQSLLGALVLQGKLHGIIVSTADYFSACVKQQRDRARTLGYTVELIDRGKLNRMLSPLLPDRPWLEILEWKEFWGLDEEVKTFFRANIRSARGDALQLRLF